jgi:hypothetical protein
MFENHHSEMVETVESVGDFGYLFVTTYVGQSIQPGTKGYHFVTMWKEKREKIGLKTSHP